MKSILYVAIFSYLQRLEPSCELGMGRDYLLSETWRMRRRFGGWGGLDLEDVEEEGCSAQPLVLGQRPPPASSSSLLGILLLSFQHLLIFVYLTHHTHTHTHALTESILPLWRKVPCLLSLPFNVCNRITDMRAPSYFYYSLEP